MDILSLAVGVFVGGAVGTVVIALAAGSRVADAEAETARLRSMLCDLRRIELQAVVRDGKGRFTKRKELV